MRGFFFSFRATGAQSPKSLSDKTPCSTSHPTGTLSAHCISPWSLLPLPWRCCTRSLYLVKPRSACQPAWTAGTGGHVSSAETVLFRSLKPAGKWVSLLPKRGERFTVGAAELHQVIRGLPRADLRESRRNRDWLGWNASRPKERLCGMEGKGRARPAAVLDTPPSEPSPINGYTGGCYTRVRPYTASVELPHSGAQHNDCMSGEVTIWETSLEFHVATRKTWLLNRNIITTTLAVFTPASRRCRCQIRSSSRLPRCRPPHRQPPHSTPRPKLR